MPALPPNLTGSFFNFNPSTQLFNFRAARGAVLSGTASARCRIALLSDSNGTGSNGVNNTNYITTNAFLWRASQKLKALGWPVNIDSAFGDHAGGVTGSTFTADNRVVLVGGGTDNSGVPGFGGGMVQMTGAGQGATFTLTTPTAYDHVDIYYITKNPGGFTIAVNGGSVLSTVTPSSNAGSIGAPFVQALTLGSMTSVTVVGVDTNTQYWMGAAFWNSTSPAIEFYNGSANGYFSTQLNNGVITGYNNYFQGAAATSPQLAIIYLSINDLANASSTPAQITAQYVAATATLRAQNCDVMWILPWPINSTNYATNFPAFRVDMQAAALTANVPIMDLNYACGQTNAVCNAAGLEYSSLHMTPAGYDCVSSLLSQMLFNS